MSPTPGHLHAPDAPAGYSWEATDEARRRALRRPGRPDRPVRPQHLPRAAGRSPGALLAAGRFETPLSEYPPSRLPPPRRRGRRALRRDPDELLVGRRRGRDPRHVRQGVPAAGRRAVVPIPTYAMYRVLTEQRGAPRRSPSRASAPRGWAMDVDAAVRAAGTRARRSSGCAARTTRPACAEPDGTIERLLDGLADGRRAPTGDRAADRRPRRGVRGVRRTVPHRTARALPEPGRRPHGRARPMRSPACGSASPIAQPATHRAAIAPYRPPGSVVDGLGHRRDRGAARPDGDSRPTSHACRRRARRGWPPALDGGRLAPAAVGRRTSCSSTSGPPERRRAVAEALLLRAASCRGRSGTAIPLAHYLRVTVRDRDENDRLIEAAREIAPTLPRPRRGRPA